MANHSKTIKGSFCEYSFMDDIKVKGIVIEASGKDAIVRFRCHKSCESCMSRRECQQDGHESALSVKNPLDAKEKDWVEIDIPKKSYYSSLLLLFGLPPAMLVVGYILALLVTGDSAASIFVSLAFFLLSFVIARVYERKTLVNGKSRPSIVRVLGK